ncbi:MAG: hypothetical protein JXR70_03955 [Spirochaetales bacterium]|nr:hypothetical protein [Spirochaetales bacterium]
MKKIYNKPVVSSKKIEAGVFGNYGKKPGNAGNINILPFTDPNFPGNANPKPFWP